MEEILQRRNDIPGLEFFNSKELVVAYFNSTELDDFLKLWKKTSIHIFCFFCQVTIVKNLGESFTYSSDDRTKIFVEPRDLVPEGVDIIKVVIVPLNEAYAKILLESFTQEFRLWRAKFYHVEAKTK